MTSAALERAVCARYFPSQCQFVTDYLAWGVDALSTPLLRRPRDDQLTASLCA